MSDTKKWTVEDSQKFTDFSLGEIQYTGVVEDPDVSIDGVVGNLSMFKAAPDLYEALEEMFIEFDDELDYLLGTDMAGRAKSALSRARGEHD